MPSATTAPSGRLKQAPAEGVRKVAPTVDTAPGASRPVAPRERPAPGRSGPAPASVRSACAAPQAPSREPDPPYRGEPGATTTRPRGQGEVDTRTRRGPPTDQAAGRRGSRKEGPPPGGRKPRNRTAQYAKNAKPSPEAPPPHSGAPDHRRHAARLRRSKSKIGSHRGVLQKRQQHQGPVPSKPQPEEHVESAASSVTHKASTA